MLPVLDGFDELSGPVYGEAVRRINAELDDSLPLLLTSRVEAWVKAVTEGDVLTAAEVVELRPLGLAQAGAHLERTARPLRPVEGATGTVWTPVLRELTARPDCPAARALTIPADGGAGPRGLRRHLPRPVRTPGPGPFPDGGGRRGASARGVRTRGVRGLEPSASPRRRSADSPCWQGRWSSARHRAAGCGSWSPMLPRAVSVLAPDCWLWPRCPWWCCRSRWRARPTSWRAWRISRR
ncbi:hypothetical protein ACRAWF_19575 [Streptomyces sp. L7]